MSQIKKRTTINTTEFGGEILSEIEEYSGDGQLIWQVKYLEGGGIESESVFEYENGHLIGEKNFNEYGGQNKTDYVYDIEGELRYKRMTFADGTTEQEKRILEPNIEIIENYNGEDFLYKKQVIKYTDEKRIKTVEFYENGELVETNFYEYNAQNQVTERIINDLKADAKYKYRYRYDVEGNEILKHLSGENEALLQKEESVFENGKLIEFREEDYLNGEERKVTKYEYDPLGNMLRETSLDWSGTIKFDKIYRINKQGDPIEAVIIETGHFDAVSGMGHFGRNLKIRYELEYF